MIRLLIHFYKTNMKEKLTLSETIIMFIFAHGATRLFSRVVNRAYERSFINSTQLHEIHAIWNRMILGR